MYTWVLSCIHCIRVDDSPCTHGSSLSCWRLTHSVNMLVWALKKTYENAAIKGLRTFPIASLAERKSSKKEANSVLLPFFCNTGNIQSRQWNAEISLQGRQAPLYWPSTASLATADRIARNMAAIVNSVMEHNWSDQMAVRYISCVRGCPLKYLH